MYTRQREVSLDRPVLVVGLDGWFDAGVGAAGAVAAILEGLPTQVVATFDTDVLLDHRSRRPTLRIEDGVNAGLRWPEIELRAGTDRAGHDLLLLVGPEPDHQWRGFTDQVVGLAVELGARLAVGLGAFPAPVPHTRPVRLGSTATSQELASTVGYVPGTIEMPAGVQSSLERGFAAAGIPAVGLWARVPHYAAGMPYPAASIALLEGLGTVADLAIEPAGLPAAAQLARERIDQLIAQSDEHQQMVARLEAQVDAEPGTPPLRLEDLPSGDEIAAELQRFLREQGPG